MTNADIQKYRQEIEEELTWRLDEIAFFNNQLNNFRVLDSSEASKQKVEDDKNRFRKVLVLVLYAHFEGFFRRSFEVYVNAIHEEKVDLSKAIDVLTTTSLHKIFRQYELQNRTINLDSDELNKSTQRLKNRDFLLREIENLKLSNKVNLPISSRHDDQDSILYTESNLTAEVIDKILYKLGFSANVFGLDDKTLEYY
ncbi:MAG: MAE_28990/MAE_18760 family HEPN-like nuclease [Microscillaceae bacterium]|nr:MAE_28990/MAE_18760 family HEPN-like nuclease [Microscillaceae bacterium]